MSEIYQNSTDFRPILFHIGLPKCGSTSLQECVFSVHGGVDLWSAEDDGVGYLRDQVIGDFLLDKLCDSAVPVYELQQEWAVIQERRAGNSGHAVVSEEMLSSVGHYRHVSARLSALEPSAEILMIVRPRAELLRSLYDMRPLDFWNGNKRFVKFDLWLKKILDPEVDGNFVHVLEYGHAIREYRKHFSPGNVHLFTLAEVSCCAESFSNFMFERFGIDGQSLQNAMSDRQRNSAELHLAKKTLRRIMGPVHASWFMSRKQIEFVTSCVGMLPWIKRTELSIRQIESIRKTFQDDQRLLTEQFSECSERFASL